MAHNAPKVTGISPKEGVPRTKLTIRGENLGADPDDIVSLKICDIECIIFMEWISPQKIITRSPNCGKDTNTGDVIVTTKRGGIGISMVQFSPLEETVGLTTPSGVWVDESELLKHKYQPPTSSEELLGSELSSASHAYSSPNASNMNRFCEFNSEAFNPIIFLVEKKSDLSFAQLKEFHKTQKQMCSSAGQNTHNSNAFLKSNVLSIIDCLNALNSFYLEYKKHRQEMGADMTAKIDEYIKSASGEAHDIFDNIISRKDKSDSTRNALNVLQRYRFLFNLPSNIDKSMQKKDYDVVINDYFRAKNLFANSSVNVFRRVFLEVEDRIKKFSLLLHETFQKYCLSVEEKNLDELKKLIKYLSALQIGEDPAWESIQLIKGTLFNKIASCRATYLSSSAGKATKDSTESPDHIEPPAEVKFIDEISKIFSVVFTDLFKLGYAYLSGDLYTKTSHEFLKHKAEIFEKEVVNESIDLLCTEFRSILLPESRYALNQGKSEADEKLVAWLPYCLRCSVNCYSNLMILDFSSIHLQNANILKQLQSFIFDLRLHTMKCLFNQASVEIKNLSTKEAWNIQLDDIYGVRTNLPLLFETKVIEILQLIRDSVLQIRNADEIDIFSQINVKGEVKILAQNLLISFLSALEKSVANPETPNSNVTVDNRSLVVLCNCSYTSNYVLPKLQEAFDKYGYPDMTQTLQNAQKKFKELEMRLLELFIEKKRDSVIGTIEPSMYMFDSNWTSVREMPKDVSYYVKETVLNLIFVQAEIYQITPQLVNKTMFIILMATLEEIERLYDSCSSKISDAARVQMLIDINAIDYVLRNTGTKYYGKLKRKIDNCRSICNASVQDQTIRKVIDDVTVQFCDSMRLQISCFHFECDTLAS